MPRRNIRKIVKLIEENTKKGEVFYPSEIADTFGLELEDVAEAVERMKKKGSLEETFKPSSINSIKARLAAGKKVEK